MFYRESSAAAIDECIHEYTRSSSPPSLPHSTVTPSFASSVWSTTGGMEFARPDGPAYRHDTRVEFQTLPDHAIHGAPRPRAMYRRGWYITLLAHRLLFPLSSDLLLLLLPPPMVKSKLSED